MRKSIVSVVALLVLSMLLAACSPVQGSAPDKALNSFLIQNSVRFTSIMGSFAQSPEYLSLFFSDPELFEFVAEIAADDYTYPNKAVIITVPDATVDAIIEEVAGGLDLPDDAREMFVTRMMAGVPGILNSHEGVMAIAATSVLSASKAMLAHEDFTENTYVILVYDNFNSVTFFGKSSESIVSASSTFLFLADDMLDAVSERTVSGYLEMFNISGAAVEYLYGEALENYK